MSPKATKKKQPARTSFEEPETPEATENSERRFLRLTIGKNELTVAGSEDFVSEMREWFFDNVIENAQADDSDPAPDPDGDEDDAEREESESEETA